MTWQQRRVQIYTSKVGRTQQFGWQNSTEREHHRKVNALTGDPPAKLTTSKIVRLDDSNAMFYGPTFDGWLLKS
jgi:hypothetical protein